MRWLWFVHVAGKANPSIVVLIIGADFFFFFLVQTAFNLSNRVGIDSPAISKNATVRLSDEYFCPECFAWEKGSNALFHKSTVYGLFCMRHSVNLYILGILSVGTLMNFWCFVKVTESKFIFEMQS